MRFVPLSALVGGAVLLAGCGSDQTAKLVGEMNKSNIQRLSNMYAGYHNMKNPAGPKDEAEFKEYIRAYAPDKLAMMGIDPAKLDDYFKSERDGQPFKVRYKVGGGRGSVAPVVFESVGKDGKKQVGFTGGKVEDVDDARYNELLSGKDSAAAPAATGPDPKSVGRPASSNGLPPGAPGPKS